MWQFEFYTFICKWPYISAEGPTLTLLWSRVHRDLPASVFCVCCYLAQMLFWAWPCPHPFIYRKKKKNILAFYPILAEAAKLELSFWKPWAQSIISNRTGLGLPDMSSWTWSGLSHSCGLWKISVGFAISCCTSCIQPVCNPELLPAPWLATTVLCPWEKPQLLCFVF